MSSTDGPEPPDPGDHLGDDPPGNDRSAIIDALLQELAGWLFDRCRPAAARHGLDPHDVFQQTTVRLLQGSVTVDLNNNGLKAWLGQLVDWAASDLGRQCQRQGGERLGVDEVVALLEEADAQAWPTDEDADGVDAAFLARFGLSPNQVGVLLGECSGMGLSLREYADLVGRSHAAVRKDKERARRLVERWIGLTTDERRVFLASRAHRSVDDAALRVDMPVPAFRHVLDTAMKKVHDALHERRDGPDGAA